jgi:hypothetical protein
MTDAAKNTEISGYVHIIHIAQAKIYKITPSGNPMVFEDHNYCGPIVLHKKTHEPLERQPDERHTFWLHYQAWVNQGKKIKIIGNELWCDYQTELQAWRKNLRAAAEIGKTML